jgi:hypothetical protein
MRRRPFNHYRTPDMPEDSPRLLLAGLIVGLVLSFMLAIVLEHA